MTTIETIELLYQAFQQNPNRLTYSTKTLCKQFAATEWEVRLAKKLYRLNPNDFTVAQALDTDLVYDSIPASDLFDTLVKNLPDDLKTNPKLQTITQLNKLEGKPIIRSRRPLNDLVKRNKNEVLIGEKSMSEILTDMNEEQWEVKQKWVKGPEGSQLMVKKEQEVDYKREFDTFLQGYTTSKKSFDIKAEDGILFVYTSDKHIGAETKEGNLLGNDYDAKEFESRMINLAKEICKVDQTYFLNEIVIVDLGDTVDGFNGKTTRGGHTLPQNMTNREVYKTFLQVHLNFMATLIDKCDCKNFSYITVGESNHGGDFEYICNKSLEAVLNLKYPQVKTFIGEKFLEHFIFGEHCFIFCHGKDIEDMKYPLPKNLDPKTELWIKSYTEQMNINSKYIHFIKGDLHLASCEYSNNLRYKNCLSLYGSSKWVQTNFMKNTKGVCMDILTNNSITEHYLFL